MGILRFFSGFIEELVPPALLIALAYVSAVLASTATYIIFSEILRPAVSPNNEFFPGLMLGFIVFAVTFALPGACAALVAWEKGYRSVFYYAATWGVTGLVISAVPPMFPDISHDTFSRLGWLVWAVSGATGGIIYWIGAGRFTRVVNVKSSRGNRPADDHQTKR